MTYLTLDQILLIHSMVIDETGGSHGIRDRGALLSTENLPRQKVFGKELYPTIFDKAAVYARNIIKAHPFVDGDKRSGMTTAMLFLEYNGYVSSAREGQIEKFALKIATGKLEISAIAKWLKKHSKR